MIAKLKRMHRLFVSISIVGLFLFSGCLTPRHMDAYVSDQFNGQVPKIDTKRTPDVSVSTSLPIIPPDISSSERKTLQFIPLIVYWHWDYRHICTLNPMLSINDFVKSLSTQARTINAKLNGRKLELVVEEIPRSFAFVDKTNIILFIQLTKFYVEPDFRDLVVTYKIIENNSAIKSGKITIKSTANNQRIRFAQGWKSSISEQLGAYHANIGTMTKDFVSDLLQEL